MSKLLRRTITQLDNVAEDFESIFTANRHSVDETELFEVISKSTDPILTVNTSEVEIFDNRCRNTDDLFAYMETTEIMNKLKDSENVLLLKILVCECLNELTEEKLNILSDLCKRKSIVIRFTIRSEFKCIIYWKSKDIQHFLSIMHYKNDFSWEDSEVYSFIADFLGDSLKKGELGISSKPSSIASKDHQKHKKIEINDLIDSNNYNILLLAAIAGNANVIDVLLEIGMGTELEGTNAQTLAWENRHSDVLLALAEADLPFADGIEISELSDTFKRFYSMIKEFHSAIECRNAPKVRKIIAENKNLKNFFNLSNVTAASIALQSKAFDIYEILLSNEILPLDHENKILKQFSKQEQKQLRDIHTKYSKNLKDKHINILMAHSYVSFNAKNEKEKLDYVRKAYEFLSKDERLDIILQIVATSNKLKIIYDFNSESIDTVDPTASEYTEGNFYLNGRIFIGAKQLLRNETKYKTLSTMAHELCHFAMDLIYHNHAKPYFDDDSKSQKEFRKVYKECDKNGEKERFIEIVYDSYPDKVHHAELIVRVPHLIALFQNQPEKLNEIISYFPKLFDYYEKHTMVDMMNVLNGNEQHPESKSFCKKFFMWIIILLIMLIAGSFISYHLEEFFYDITDPITTDINPYIISSVKISDEIHFPTEGSLHLSDSTTTDPSMESTVKKWINSDQIHFPTEESLHLSNPSTTDPSMESTVKKWINSDQIHFPSEKSLNLL